MAALILALRLQADTHQTLMNTDWNLTKGPLLCVLRGRKIRILLARQNFFWVELLLDS
jgi:hypothetical protein